MAKTDSIRPGKVENGEDLRSLNQVGKRIKWIREQLILTPGTVSRATGIPKSSYCGRENGSRAIYHEEYFVLASFFNELWREKFKEAFPSYEGEKIYRIKVSWILFGVMDD